MPPRPSPARVPGKPRRRESIPPQIAEEVISFGRLLAELFGPAFSANPRLKFSVGRMLTAQLPPLPRPRGRPGFAQVSRAIAMRESLQKARPEMTLKQIWREIYRTVIPGYHGLTPPERRDAQDQLRERTHWRLRARRRRGKLRMDLSVL